MEMTPELNAKVEAMFEDEAKVAALMEAGTPEEVKAVYAASGIDLDDENAAALIASRDQVMAMDELPEELLELATGGAFGGTTIAKIYTGLGGVVGAVSGGIIGFGAGGFLGAAYGATKGGAFGAACGCALGVAAGYDWNRKTR